MNTPMNMKDGRGTLMRWLKFNAVGGLGIGVQLATLAVCKSGFNFGVMPATALAVEAAVIHNFVWHERYTWAGRVRPCWRRSLLRLLRFHLANGVVSLTGNVALMEVLVSQAHMNYFVANGIAIASCALANFLLSEKWVFEE